MQSVFWIFAWTFLIARFGNAVVKYDFLIDDHHGNVMFIHPVIPQRAFGTRQTNKLIPASDFTDNLLGIVGSITAAARRFNLDRIALVHFNPNAAGKCFS